MPQLLVNSQLNMPMAEQIKAIRLIETENRPDSKADASFNGTHGEYTNNNVTWTKQ